MASGPPIGTATIVVGADTSQTAAQIESGVTSAAEKGGSAFGGVFSRVAKAGAIAGGLAIGASLGVGLSTAMESEIASMKFAQLFHGQTEKAEGFIQDLKDFAARTPFDFPGLQDAASRFLAVGVEANRVIPIMTTLGDATSIMGTGAEGIQRATTALTQMAQKGKVTGEEMLQLTEAGIPAWQALADSMGKTVPEVQKLATKGLIPAEEAFKALENAAGPALQTVSGGMEKMAQTTQGKISTLKDNFSQMMGGLVETALPTLNLFVDFLSNTAIPKIQAGFDVVQPHIQKVVEWISKAAAEGDGLGGVWSRITAATAPVVAIFKGLFAAGEEVHTMVSDVENSAGPLATRFETTTTAAGPLHGIFEKIKTAVMSLVTAFKDFFGATEPVTTQIDDVVNSAGPLADKFQTIEGSGGGLAGVMEKVGAAISGIDWSNIGAQAGKIFDDIQKLGPLFAEMANTHLPNITSAFKVGMALLGFFADHVDTLVDLMPLLVAAFIALKVAQLAANLVSAATPALRIAEIVVNKRLAASQKELTGAIKAQSATQKGAVASETAATGAKNAGVLATLRAKAAAVGHAIATKAVAAATKAWSVVQAAFNLIMSANPIVLVALAIAALVAGVIIAYQKVGWFRDLVDGAFKIIAAAGQWLWETVLKPIFDIWIGYFQLIVAGAQLLWQGLQAAWDGIWAAVEWLVGAIMEGWDGLLSWLSEVPATILGFLDGMWDFIWEQVSTMVANVIAFAQGVVTWFQELPGKIVAAATGMWDFITDEVGEMKTAVVAKATEVVTWFAGLPQRILGALANLGSMLYEAGKGVIERFWSGLKNIWESVSSWFLDKVDWITGLWPFSPAKHGPLRQHPPEDWGRNIGSMLVDGLESQASAVERAALGLTAGLSAPRLPRGGDGAAAGSLATAGAGSGLVGAGAVTVYMTVSVDDLAKMSKVADFVAMLDNARVAGRRTLRSGMVSA